jgi:hypothetical protein
MYPWILGICGAHFGNHCSQANTCHKLAERAIYQLVLSLTFLGAPRRGYFALSHHPGASGAANPKSRFKINILNAENVISFTKFLNY